MTWRTGRYNACRVLLPSTWRYRDASYPSDHSTDLWYDPSNPLCKLLVTVSGCIETDFDAHRPNPKGELPSYATGLYWTSPWKLAFSGCHRRPISGEQARRRPRPQGQRCRISDRRTLVPRFPALACDADPERLLRPGLIRRQRTG